MSRIMPSKTPDFRRRMDKIQKRERMHPSASPLTATKNMFRDHLGIYDPLSYEEWLAFDSGDKAAALYVNFFTEISLAWFKAKSYYSLEEDGVSIVLQYLQKNVPIIEADHRRYDAKYIYRVAYNCMYCQARDIKRDREAFENETSNICNGADGEETNIFDYLQGKTCEQMFESEAIRRNFWYEINQLGDDAMAVVNHLLSGDSIPRKIKPRTDEILEQLQQHLGPFISVDF